MSNKPTKQQDLIAIAEKGGNDAALLLLDKIHDLEDRFETHTKEMGEAFNRAIDQIKENVPDLNKVLESIKGKDGKDSEIAGPKGDSIKGDPGIDYVLTEKDKIEIPVVEKVIIEKPTITEKITNEIKEIAIAENAEQVRDKLETLKGNERLDKDAIKGLDEEFEKVKKTIGGRSVNVFGGRNGGSYYDISSSLNGSTKTFWIPTNMGVIAVLGSSAPFIFRPTTDWTESGHNIVFDAAIDATNALAAGQTVVILIKRN